MRLFQKAEGVVTFAITCAVIDDAKARVEGFEATGSREVLIDQSVHVLGQRVLFDQRFASDFDQLVEGFLVLAIEHAGDVGARDQVVELLLHVVGDDLRRTFIRLRDFAGGHASELMFAASLEHFARKQPDSVSEERFAEWISGVGWLDSVLFVRACEAPFDQIPDRCRVLGGLKNDRLLESAEDGGVRARLEHRPRAFQAGENGEGAARQVAKCRQSAGEALNDSE